MKNYTIQLRAARK